jgi:hypothetical protein
MWMACRVGPPKPVSLALSKLESYFEFSLPVDPSVQRLPPGLSSAALREAHVLNKQLTFQTLGLSSSRGGGVWGMLARCTKSPASLAKLAMGSVRECPRPLGCRGLIKIRSRRGVLRVLTQHPPIRRQTCRSMSLSRPLLLALRLMIFSTAAQALSNAGLCLPALRRVLQYTSCQRMQATSKI